MRGWTITSGRRRRNCTSDETIGWTPFTHELTNYVHSKWYLSYHAGWLTILKRNRKTLFCTQSLLVVGISFLSRSMAPFEIPAAVLEHCSCLAVDAVLGTMALISILHLVTVPHGRFAIECDVLLIYPILVGYQTFELSLDCRIIFFVENFLTWRIRRGFACLKRGFLFRKRLNLYSEEMT